MGFFSKLMFWRHEEPEIPSLGGMGQGMGQGSFPSFDSQQDFAAGFGRDSTSGLGGTSDIGAWPSAEPKPLNLGYPQQQMQQPSQQSPFQQSSPRYQEAPQQQFLPQQTLSKDIEIISYKLDALKATIESVNQRLATLERIAKGEEEERRYRY